MVPGPIAVIYNVSGVTDLTLTPSVLAQIFSGKITNVERPGDRRDQQRGHACPTPKITTVHRSDSSGTTDNFTKYLTAAAGERLDLRPRQGSGRHPGGQGAKGSDGVAAAVKNTPSAIGYVEWSFATLNNLSVAKIDNGGGAVELTPDAVSKAVGGRQGHRHR